MAMSRAHKLGRGYYCWLQHAYQAARTKQYTQPTRHNFEHPHVDKDKTFCDQSPEDIHGQIVRSASACTK
jgi:hypothetical protein